MSRSRPTVVSFLILAAVIAYVVWQGVPDTDAPERPEGTAGQPVVVDDAREATDKEAKEDEGRAGTLRDVGRGVLESPAGLQYPPGSLEGHRLKHVLRHAQDQPDRPGSHGVFDGDQEDIIALIDEAYLLAERDPRRVRRATDDNRQILTVDMQRRIGYVGGQRGRSRGHPAARHVRLILEETRVITAYPYLP